MFEGKEFVLDVSSKQLVSARRTIENYGGVVSFTLSRQKTSYLLTTGDRWQRQTYKIQCAQKYSIPIVDISFISACIQKHKIVPAYLFAPKVPTTPDPIFSLTAEPTPLFRRTAEKLNKVDSIPYQPHQHDYGFELAAWHFLLKISTKNHGEFCVLELHVNTDGINNTNKGKYHVFTHKGFTKDLIVRNGGPSDIGEKRIYVLSSIGEAEALYDSLLTRYTKWESYRRFQMVSSQIGSHLMTSSVFAGGSNMISILQPQIQQLVTTIYKASESRANVLLERIDKKRAVVPLGNLALQDIERAEASLRSLRAMIKRCVDCSNDDYRECEELYHRIIFQQKGELQLRDIEVIMKHQELCQLLKDRLCCNEGLGSGCLIDRQFAALSCNIQSVSSRFPAKFEQLQNQIISSTNQQITITEIYEISQEGTSFTSDIGNIKQLYHGTSASNLLGLLSRGFIVPHSAEANWYLTGSRRDGGMLGAGIYFTDDPAAAAGYSSNYEQNRYMLIADVALGNIYETPCHQPSFVKAPKGFQSVLGVKGKYFNDREFVIYSSTQQKLRYLVQFHYQDENSLSVVDPFDSVQVQNENLELILASAKELFEETDETIGESTINTPWESFDMEECKYEPDVGLLSSEGTSVPLKSSHIRANLLDMVGTVEIHQEYVNESKNSIEAKYVFPLDEKGAVCGFEAHINGKHVIGQVKEKRQAHREYKAAVEHGHGAYLMDQHEKPDAWTVTVGNLPPQAKVIIKIIYVTELDIEADDLIFRFPASLSTAAKTKVSQENTQTHLDTTIVDNSAKINESFQLTFQMPYPILRMYSPSHGDCFLMKSTETIGTVWLKDEIESLGSEDFEFRITIWNAKEPRLWIAEEEESSHKAAMLCFYPEFDFSPQLDNEFLFLIDRSASMSGYGVKESYRVMSLFLKYLPTSCYFNLIAFGSTTESLYFLSQLNTPENVLEAREWLQDMYDINLGSTDLQSLLHRIYLRVHSQRAPRHLLLISDGQIHRFEAVSQVVERNAEHTRLFTIGVGNNVNRHSLYALGCAGRGSTEVFGWKISQQFNDVDKVERLYAKAMQPAISNVELDWLGDDGEIEQAPKSILSVFNGERKVIYAMLGESSCTQVTVRSQGADGERLHVRVGMHTVSAFSYPNDMIHKLAARALLRDYEEGTYSEDPITNAQRKAEKKGDMIELSCSYNVVCSLTSFLAVEMRSEEESVDWTATDIDSLVSQSDLISYIGWGEGMDTLSELYERYKNFKRTEVPFEVTKDSNNPLHEVDAELCSSEDDLDNLLMDIDEDLRKEECGDNHLSIDDILNELMVQKSCKRPSKKPREISGKWIPSHIVCDDDISSNEEYTEKVAQLAIHCELEPLCERKIVEVRRMEVAEVNAMYYAEKLCVAESVCEKSQQFYLAQAIIELEKEIEEPEEAERNPSFLRSLSLASPQIGSFMRPTQLDIPNSKFNFVCRENEEAPPQFTVQYDTLVSLQNESGYWELSLETEESMGLQPGTFLKILHSVDYATLGNQKSIAIERQFVTAVAIELLLGNPEWATCDSIQLALTWLEQMEKQDISLCYILGLSSNWRAKARQVIKEYSLDESTTGFNPHICAGNPEARWIAF